VSFYVAYVIFSFIEPARVKRQAHKSDFRVAAVVSYPNSFPLPYASYINPETHSRSRGWIYLVFTALGAIPYAGGHNRGMFIRLSVIPRVRDSYGILNMPL